MSIALIEERTAQQVLLDIERKGIRFFNVTPDRVRIQITVRNIGETRSRPTPLHLQSAPLGAFLSWRPLTSLIVPALDPQGQVQLQTDVDRPKAAPLGNFARVPPRRLLTAIGNDDSGEVQPTAYSLSDLRRRRSARLATRKQSGDVLRMLAPDLFDFLGHRNPHWAGNINVFTGRRSVARHVARALRVCPGRTNVAIFLVGTRPDAYSFALAGSLAPHARLVDCVSDRPLAQQARVADGIPPQEWVEARACLVVMLVMRLPQICREGKLEVYVRQRSTAKRATVEFSLDANAAGPGCYTV